jgi:hypothetical protein
MKDTTIPFVWNGKPSFQLPLLEFYLKTGIRGLKDCDGTKASASIVTKIPNLRRSRWAHVDENPRQTLGDSEIHGTSATVFESSNRGKPGHGTNLVAN